MPTHIHIHSGGEGKSDKEKERRRQRQRREIHKWGMDALAKFSTSKNVCNILGKEIKLWRLVGTTNRHKIRRMATRDEHRTTSEKHRKPNKTKNKTQCEQYTVEQIRK